TYTPVIPCAVFSARKSTPVRHSPMHLNRAKKFRSWYESSSTSQPPAPDAVPVSSPFCAFHCAAPSVCHPASVDPLNVESGRKSFAGPCALTQMTADAAAATTPAIRMPLRAIAQLLLPAIIDERKRAQLARRHQIRHAVLVEIHGGHLRARARLV